MVTITALLAVALLAGGCASQAASPAAGTGSASGSVDAAAIIQARCTKCHSIDRIKAANHDQAGWTATIARMQGKGAQLSSAEGAAVVQFLAGGGGSKL